MHAVNNMIPVIFAFSGKTEQVKVFVCAFALEIASL